MILFISFIVLVPGAALVAVISKLRYVQEVLNRQDCSNDINQQRKLSFDLQSLGLATDTDRLDLKRYVDGWYVEKTYAAFLSHFKNEAAAEARVLKSELVRGLRTREDQIFLDADNLTDLRELLNCVKTSDALILMYTNAILSRPWCLLEVATAVENDVPIIVMRVANAFAGNIDEIPTILDDLSGYLAKTNPMAEETLRAFNYSANTLGPQIKSAIGLSKDDVISFDPHQSVVILQNQIRQVAAALVNKVCPENASLLDDLQPVEADLWPVVLKHAVYIIHEEQNPTIVAQAAKTRQWLLDNTKLNEDQVVLQIDTCSGRTRDINDVTPADLVPIAEESDCVLLVQSANVMKEPRCLSRLYTATTYQVPIVPVVLMKSKAEHDKLVYDFDAAKHMMEDLGSHVDATVSAAVAQATKTSINAVGLALSLVLPNIISKPVGLDASKGELHAQMSEVERTLRRSTRGDSNIDRASVQTPQAVWVPKAGRSSSLSQDDVEQLRNAFARVDANGDGGITRDEIMSAIRKDRDLGHMLGLHGETDDERVFEAGRVFQSMDTDGDEEIDVDEFVNYFGVAPMKSMDLESGGQDHCGEETREENGEEDLLPDSTTVEKLDARP